MSKKTKFKKIFVERSDKIELKNNTAIPCPAKAKT
jgi:hypothetical protein